MNDLVTAEVSMMSGAAALPRDNGALVFETPWQGRVFALAVEAVRNLGLPWDAFRQHLIAAIGENPARPYYESWVVALERLLDELGVAAST